LFIASRIDCASGCPGVNIFTLFVFHYGGFGSIAATLEMNAIANIFDNILI
jgi:hypothetical protein